MTEERFKERLNEIYRIGSQMRKSHGDQLAESRYREIVAELLLLILDSLHSLRTALFFLIGLLFGNLLADLLLKIKGFFSFI